MKDVMDRKPQFGYSKSEWEVAVKSPVIVHFTTSFLSIRPWFEGSNHPYAKQWKEVHDETPWKDEPWRVCKDRKSRDRKELVFKRVSRGLAVRVAGFLHSFVKPVFYVICSKNMN